MLKKEDVTKACLKWPGLYEDRDGRRFKGTPCSEVPTRLVDDGWKRVSQYRDPYDLKQLGLTVVTARYVGGARPARFCKVVDLEEETAKPKPIILIGCSRSVGKLRFKLNTPDRGKPEWVFTDQTPKTGDAVRMIWCGGQEEPRRIINATGYNLYAGEQDPNIKGAASAD
jgi:hypothetical protein